MIVDQSIFGLSRTGVIDNRLRYPLLLEAGKDVKYANGKLIVLDKELTGANIGPHFLGGNSELLFPTTEDFIIVPNGIELLLRPRQLISTLNDILDKFGFTRLIYLQGVPDPYLLPVLVYAGVSVFDSSLFEIEGISHERFTPMGKMRNSADNGNDNIEFVKNMLEILSLSIANGTLRDTVEKFQFSAKAIEILRIIDRDYKERSRQFFPARTPRISAYSIDSLNRPDMEIYRDYIAHKYRKPDSRGIALLLPCSARKPYSTSKSHKRIISVLGKLRPFIHEIIVTSPVGIVPRELESVYPPAFYDIPVTGHWYDEEKDMIGSMLLSYFKNNSYSRIISFVTEDLSFIHDFLPENTIELKWDKRNDESLETLRSTISGLITGETVRVAHMNLSLEAYVQIARFQFGDWIEDYLKKAKIKRIYNSDMLVIDGNPVLVYNERLGKFTINKISGKWFLDNTKFCVEIDDFKPTANVYPVGILNVTGDVRQEDEVAIHHNGELRGVGIAKMPRQFMLQLKKGVAVKVRN